MVSKGTLLRLLAPPVVLLAFLGVGLGGCGDKAGRETSSTASTTAPSTPKRSAIQAAAANAAASSAAWDVGQWSVYGEGALSVSPGRAYGLLNNYNQKSLRYKSREYGINLDWDDKRTGRYITFLRPSGATTPLTYGEAVAIGVAGGGYLRYKERKYGINLDWSSTPVYEWEIDGQPFGTQVLGDADAATVQSTGRSTYRIRLYNRTHGDYLVYGVRDYGINLKWYADEIGGAEYPAVPFPAELRGPSGEPGQALLEGNAWKTEVFHGGTDDELDWHIFIHIDPAIQASLANHLVAHAKGANCAHLVNKTCYPLRVSDLDNGTYAEWMVMDGYDNSTTDELFYSADVGNVLGLGQSAWSYSAAAGNSQNVTGAKEVPKDSTLINSGARVYMQGPLVNDSYHGFLLEIHPLDSVAYALDANRNPLTVNASSPQWPSTSVTWRVAAFTNSTIHRVDGAEYLKKDRTTTWWLPLPATAAPSKFPVAPKVQFRVSETAPGLENYAVAHAVGGLDKRRPGEARYTDYGLVSKSYAIERDPADGKTKLRVTVTMARPDFWGGMFLRDYTITAEKPVAKR